MLVRECHQECHEVPLYNGNQRLFSTDKNFWRKLPCITVIDSIGGGPTPKILRTKKKKTNNHNQLNLICIRFLP